MNKKPKGGKRPGAGRKAIADTKEPLTLYVLKTDIKEWGGKKVLRDRLHEYVASPANDRKITQKLEKEGKIPKTIQGPIIGSKEHLDGVLADANKMQAKYAPVVEMAANRLPITLQDDNRIKELKHELANPPKNPMVGLTMWTKVRQTELDSLRKKYGI